MPAGAALILLVILAAVLVAPVVALVALTRVKRLEREVASLRGALQATVAEPASAEMPTPPPHSRATAPTAVDIADQIVAARTPAAPVELPRALAGFDWEHVIAGKGLNRIGLVAVTIGVAYFLKHAIDNAWIGPRGQVALGLLLGVGIIAAAPSFIRRGWTYFGDGLTGLGGAILYLSLWAAGSYYGMIAPLPAMLAMTVVTAALLAIAFGRGSPTVAVLALVGGFATPALLSTGQDAQIELFSYLALLNGALLAAARARGWRLLELPAYILTQLYFWVWFAEFYHDDSIRPWISTLGFATLFFAQFSALAVLRVRAGDRLAGDQIALVLLNASTALLTLRAIFWPDDRWTLTVLVMALAAAHLALARIAGGTGSADPIARPLFAGLALTLLTLVIPIRLDGHWVTLAWAIEAAVLMWTGVRQRVWQLRGAAFLTFLAVALRIAADPIAADTVVFNARLATYLVVAAAAAWSAWLLWRTGSDVSDEERTVAGVLAVAANVLVLSALTQEVLGWFRPYQDLGRAIDPRFARTLAVSLLWSAYAAALVLAGIRSRLVHLRWQGLLLFGVTIAKVFTVDLGLLPGFYRITSSIALGLVLLAVSFWYQRRLSASTEGRA